MTPTHEFSKTLFFLGKSDISIGEQYTSRHTIIIYFRYLCEALYNEQY